jgi:DNA-directed RNA polymerase specialized sigma54-like protein
MSDAELAREMAGLGYPVARRTVAKYRARLGIVAHGVR